MKQILSLDGVWRLRQDDRTETLPAPVPGTVHQALLTAGILPDPYPRDQELAAQWVGEARWTYARTFAADPVVLSAPVVRLRCHGLDTLAAIRINDREIGRADNMFRTWVYDIRAALRPGLNTIEVAFASPVVEARARYARLPLRCPHHAAHEPPGITYLRKEQCNFGWDWGPCLPTAGIWRAIALEAVAGPEIADVVVRQHHRRGAVRLDLAIALAGRGIAGGTVEVVLRRRGRRVAAAETAAGRRVEVRLAVPSPRLWWPNGLGEQPLYDLEVRLRGADGRVHDQRRLRIGLRTLELRRQDDAWGQGFAFACNGVPFFAKGSNWIPADAILDRITPDVYRRLLTAARDSHQNMIRVWGRGLYEADAFYDLCDELGLCVWQDFMFACGAYPAFDDAFLRNVAAEVDDNVRRLRHHPSIALWCGNNELEQFCCGDAYPQFPWPEYRGLFDRLIPGRLRRLDPDRPYIPSSGHNPRGKRAGGADPRWGDSHLWEVWHGREPFEWYRSTSHRFCSEFGFQSFPEPQTVAGFTDPEDRNVTSPVMEHHQRSGIGNRVILEYMLRAFRMPAGFDQTLWLSQIQQGLGVACGIDHWRRNMPRCMGALYWQLNDCWPAPSWSSIDYHGRWKALHYFVRRAFAPIRVSCIADPVAGTVGFFVASDRRDPRPARLHWTLTDIAGRELSSGAKPVRIPANGARRLHRISLARLRPGRPPDDLLVWVRLTCNGHVLSEDFATLVPPKRLRLHEPGLQARVLPQGPREFAVTLTARAPALWTWIELAGTDIRCSDNFFCLPAHLPRSIRVCTAKPLPLPAFRRALAVRSLLDTFRIANSDKFGIDI